ncbi:cytochrome c oxidase subunit 3 [Candidatus Binatus sp.]|uniref:cytochrome c oxidase subunit 3 n=1 Tax=Candidatus Binatus sp. TaxID=2811406 RepID=UPI002B467EC1|nr:cytochrome c oxidase subunit 3 [Candidatus Binatus sp.]
MTASTVKVRPLVAPVRRGRSSDSGASGDQRERPFISSGMLAIMMLIASEMMLFSGLIGSFLIFRLQAAFWPPPALPRLPIAVTWVNTFVLLSSALTMTLALRGVHRSRQRLTRRYLLATLALGVTFLAVQGSEWVRLVAHGLKLSSGAYGGTFYLLIGCHGAHVTAGVIWLACVAWLAMGGRYNARNAHGIELCAVYWYFVCAVWPLLFGLVYLM